MRIALINLPSTELDLVANPKLETLGLGYLAAYLRREGHAVTIRDANIRSEHLTVDHPLFQGGPFSIIGFSCLTNNVSETIRLIPEIKRRWPSTHVTLGGYYATFNYETLLETEPGIDSVVMGEGEQIMAGLASRLEGMADWRLTPGIAFRSRGKIATNTPPSPLPLDELPFPARDTLLDVHATGNRIATVSTSRGCYMRCSFCSIPAFYGLASRTTYRERSPSNVISELRELLEFYSESEAPYIWFCDDEFVGPLKPGVPTHGEQIAQAITDAKLEVRFEIECRADRVEEGRFALLRDAGLRRVFLGVESFLNSDLKYFRKGSSADSNTRAIQILDKLDIDYIIGFIPFTPEVRLEDYQRNLSLLREIGFWRVLRPFNRLKMFSGTRLTKQRALEPPGPNNASIDDVLAGDEAFGYAFEDERMTRNWNTICRYVPFHRAGILALQRRYQAGELSAVEFWTAKNALFHFTGTIMAECAESLTCGGSSFREIERVQKLGPMVPATLATFDPGSLKKNIQAAVDVQSLATSDADSRHIAAMVSRLRPGGHAWLELHGPLSTLQRQKEFC